MDPQVVAFGYRSPAKQADERPKWSTQLARTDLMRANVQFVNEGGENNLHSHPNTDGFWMVLRGACRFYGVGDEMIGELHEGDGLLISRGTQYWFEAIGDVRLEILHVAAYATVGLDGRADRVEHARNAAT